MSDGIHHQLNPSERSDLSMVDKKSSGMSIVEILVALAILGVVFASFTSTFIDNTKLRKYTEVRSNLGQEIDPVVRAYFKHQILPQLRASCKATQMNYSVAASAAGGSIAIEPWKDSPAFLNSGVSEAHADQCKSSPLSAQGVGQKNMYYCIKVRNLKGLARQKGNEGGAAYLYIDVKFYSPFVERKPSMQLQCFNFARKDLGTAMAEVFYKVYWVTQEKQNQVLTFSNTFNFNNI